MKRPFALLLAGVCFASACLASPEPPETPPAEETAVAPVAAPVIRPKVGGPCAYETSVIAVPVTAVYENTVQLTDPDAREFNLPASAFEAPPAIGDLFNVTKRRIIQGTCQPFLYAYAGPYIPPEPAPETPAD